jgi:O-methyltransferase involved in polyketide biosynthesis
MYLPADAQDRLFEQVTELSAPGSRVSAEAVAHRDESRRAEMRERFEKFADQLGFDRRIDIGELTYNDPDRSDLVEWLNAHGWTASVCRRWMRCAGWAGGSTSRWVTNRTRSPPSSSASDSGRGSSATASTPRSEVPRETATRCAESVSHTQTRHP